MFAELTALLYPFILIMLLVGSIMMGLSALYLGVWLMQRGYRALNKPRHLSRFR